MEKRDIVIDYELLKKTGLSVNALYLLTAISKNIDGFVNETLNRLGEHHINFDDLREEVKEYILVPPDINEDNIDAIGLSEKWHELFSGIDVYALQFEEFRKIYPGTKRGLNTEFSIFKKHKDWKSVLPTLVGAVIMQKEAKSMKKGRGEFVAEWKNMQTWLNQRCWEEEIPVNIVESYQRTRSL